MYWFGTVEAILGIDKLEDNTHWLLCFVNFFFDMAAMRKFPLTSMKDGILSLPSLRWPDRGDP